jgi:hypothetical protein
MEDPVHHADRCIADAGEGAPHRLGGVQDPPPRDLCRLAGMSVR